MITSTVADHSESSDVTSAERSELLHRMQRPQRHRLLHGYPLAAAMPRIGEQVRREKLLPEYDPRRGLLVGVLPHPFCNPAVAGCGFCTFPHEMFSTRKAGHVIHHVIREIEQTMRTRPDLAGRSIAALYFGGGSANLSPPEPFRMLCRTLAKAIDLTAAEVSLEGVPAAFVNRTPLLVDILQEELPARHFRLSMGIQTFDRDRLQQMGRLGFGDTETFRDVVKLGHDRGFTVSGDMLFNLPAQSLAEMKNDVRQAGEIGLDHLGLYHLVMFEGLGTPWARDPALISALPSNTEAAGNWLELRELLLGLGFYQTTLTNFERQELRGRDERFMYEELSFRPDRYDMIGFGPTGISFVDTGLETVRVINPVDASSYIAAVDTGRPAWDRGFVYGRDDLRVFHLTRRLAALEISRPGYMSFFGSDPVDDFPREFAAIEEEGLVQVTDRLIEPTPRGMFYSDSIAALLARRAIRDRRKHRSWGDLHEFSLLKGNDNAIGHM